MRAVSKVKYLFVCTLGVGVLFAVYLSPIAYAQEITSGDAGSSETTAQDSEETDGSCDASFLGFPAWYNGLTVMSGDSCEIKSPTDVGGIGPFIWAIVFNVVEMLLRAAGYAAVAFIIYGGYRYMTSAGSADGIASAKKTITNAIIGLILSIAAVAIVRAVSNGLLG